MDPVPEKTVFVPRAAAPTDLFLKDDVVGQYKVEKVLGAGGMGVVYLVKHTALKKEFALKALPAKLSQEPSFVRRFKKEAEMLGRLKHSHIVNVTDFGESQGRLYLVLEFVNGGTLEEWFLERAKSGGGVPAADVMRMLAQILEGLAHAHQAGIVHRDLKPANVLLEKTGEAKISDFGLARVVEEEEYRRTGGTASPFQGDSVSTTGSIVGTIDFMSPEAKNMRPSDARSDIFAVGVIAYYLLTGKKPHGLAKDASQLVPGLDPRWDKFIRTCLAEDPANRYQTATLALEGLRQIQQPAGGKRWLVPAIIAAVAVIGLGLWWSQRAPPPVNSIVRNSAPGAVPVAPAPVAAPVNNPEPEKPLPNAAALRKFAVTGLPVGAELHDGRRKHLVGSTGRVELDLKPGPQLVKIRAAGYLDWEGEVGGTENATEMAIQLEEIPPHPVRFTGLPPKAEIKVGDQTAVADPSGMVTFKLKPGRVVLSVSAEKYETLKLGMDIQTATEIVPLEMKRLPPSPAVTVKLPDGTEMKFKWVPAGNFFVGSPADERGRQRNDLTRTRTEILKGFYVAETEMTQRQHKAVTGRNPSTSRALGDDNRPVEQVAWRDLAGSGGVIEKFNALLRKLDLPFKADLPTEVEWEYACRAGTDSAFNDGSDVTNDRDDPALNALGFYTRGGSHDAPSPVAKFKPNRWGLYDMHGNVAEWAYGARGGVKEPVVRGGNWKVGPVHCRSASRVELTAETRSNDTMGYRLVLKPVED